jgi:hypothetical protein
MKSLRIAVLSLLAMLGATLAHASTIPPPDPVIKQGGGDPPSSPSPIFTPDFTILSPSGTSPATSACKLIEGTFTFTSPSCLFQDVINPSGAGEAITKLVFDIATVSPSTVNCALINMVDFATCVVGPFDETGTMVGFHGGKGIPYMGEFTLNFDDFPKNTSFSGLSTTAIPEPNTLALFLAGIGALLIGRRLRARSLS